MSRDRTARTSDNEGKQGRGNEASVDGERVGIVLSLREIVEKRDDVQRLRFPSRLSF